MAICRNKGDQVAYNTMYCYYRSGARKRNLVFELTKDQFKQIVSLPCYFCGDGFRQYNPYLRKDKKVNQSMKYSIDHAYITVTGVDRIDSSKGYTIENVQPCCEMCNWMKRHFSAETFIKKCQEVTKQHGNI